MPAGLEFVIVAGAAVVLVLVLFVAVRVVARGLFGRERRLETELALEVLDGRLARGEITREEYDQARRALGA